MEARSLDQAHWIILLALLTLTASLAGCLGQKETQPTRSGADRPTAADPFSTTDVLPGEYNTSGNFSQVLDEGSFTSRTDGMANLSSPVDGARIQLTVVRPEVPDGRRVPVILDASPYYTSPDYRDYDQARFLLENFVEHGYAVAMLARRGTGGSGGCSEAMSPETGADLDHAITWLAERDWSSGKVGMVGLSADGQLAWQGASLGNEHVETIVPIAGWPSHFHRFFRNGTTTFESVQRAVPSGPFALATDLLAGPRPSEPAELRRLVRSSACPEAEGALAWPYAAATGQPDPAGYWSDRNLREAIEEGYDGSVFVVHGFQDRTVRPWNVYPWVGGLAEEGLPVKQLIGQWAHSRPDEVTEPDVEDPHLRWDFAQLLLHWFDRWLKGDTSRDLGPRVQVEDAQGRWRSEESWPPGDAQAARLHLTPEGSLAAKRSGSTGSATIGLDAGAFTRSEVPCPACAVFVTEPRTEPLRFGGLPRAHVTVTPLGPGGYLTATLHVVHANGTAQFLTDTDIDLRYADGDGEPDNVRPGRSLVARMQLGPVDAVVPEGARLALTLSQGNAGGDVELAPSGAVVFEAFLATAPTQPVPVRLELGEGRSTLTIDTFDRDPAAFFRPPGVGANPSIEDEARAAEGPPDGDRGDFRSGAPLEGGLR